MVSFAGWEMPIHYTGVLAEHHAVRNDVGLFDVSHMGRIHVTGPDAERFLDALSTNQINGKKDGTATYTVWCHDNGYAVDDVIVYKTSSEAFFVIVNAANRSKDLDHMLKKSKGYDVHIQDCFATDGVIALQGPSAEPLLASLIPEAKQVKNMHFIVYPDEDGEIIVSRTGYTGAGGFEIYGPNALIVKWWDTLLEKGKPYHIQPAGLGARDTLRLEKGFALYGHELSDTIAPNESVAAWTIKWQKEFFYGKEALQQLDSSPLKRWSYGIKLLDKGIAREGFPLFKDDRHIGVVTSGTFSPTLNQSIALILVNMPLKNEEIIGVQVRQQNCRAQVVLLPFI